MSDPIPLAALLAEGLGDGAQSIDALEAQITAAGHPVVIDYIGRKAVARDVARVLLAEHQAAARATAEREQRRRAEFKALMRELDARYGRQTLRGGVPAVPGNALADLMGADQR
jgi:hypothetical protein